MATKEKVKKKAAKLAELEENKNGKIYLRAWKLILFEPFHPYLSQLNTMDGRVHSVLRGLKYISSGEIF